MYAPCHVTSDEIPEQCGAQAKADTAYDRLFHFRDRDVEVAVANIGVVKRVVWTIGIPSCPSGAEVTEGHDLEIADELYVDGSVGEIAEQGEA